MVKVAYNFVRRQYRALVLLGLGAAIATGLAWYALFGLPAFLQDPDKLAALIRAPGWTTTLVTLAVFIVLGAIGIPSAVIIIALAAVLPFQTAFGLGLVGGLGASMLGFWLSRHFARDLLEPRIPPKVRRFEARLEKHAFSTVIILRLMFFLFPPVNWLLGLSHVRFGTFVVATAIGCIPGMFIYTLTGNGVVPWLLNLPRPLLAAIVIGGAAGLTAWWFFVIRPTRADDEPAR